MALMGGGSFSSGVLIAGKYRLQKQLGEGAMGVVWSAVNSATGGAVALKLIVRSDQELQTRLVREARACGLIRHKNVVQVHDVGTTEGGDPFLVMELLQGETLAALLARKRRLAPNEAAGIARDVARALSAAHNQGIIHRDLKPANIFLHSEPGEDAPVVKVVDFGVSKNLAQSDGLRTVAGGAVGSPMYMSPEQARAERDVDYRADIWSLGVVLYEMLAGERPFLGDATEVLVKIASGPIPRIAKRVRKIDPDLDRIVAACLTRERESRLHPASEVARQLETHAMPAPREPLPSLMDTGGYDAPPVATPSSGGAPFSPGSGPTSLQAAISPGSGRTELRPSSQGGALRSAGAPASGSGGQPMMRSGSWSRPVEEDEAATKPLDPRMLAPLAAIEPEDDDWGRGGTIPIHPQQAAFIAAMANPAPPTAPPPPTPPPPPSAPEMAAPQRAKSFGGTTMPMDIAPIAFQQGYADAARMEGPPRIPTAPPAAMPTAAPAQKKPLDKRVFAAVGVALTASLLAVLVWRLTSGRSAVDPSPAQPVPEATAATVVSPVPQNTASSQPSSTEPPTAPSATNSAPPATTTAEPTTAQTPPKPAPTTPPKPSVTNTGTKAPPATTKPAGTTKSASTAKPPATGKKTCDKFGICK